jgi:hypothetical protein
MVRGNFTVLMTHLGRTVNSSQMARALPKNYKFVRASRVVCGACAGILLSIAAVAPAQADNFSRVYYDAGTDQLVVTMRYRGTNPDHTFSLQWGQCKVLQGSDLPEVAVEVLDSQGRDAARQDFKTTTRFDLSDLPCRAAKVTLRTAPRFYFTLVIPALGASRH